MKQIVATVFSAAEQGNIFHGERQDELGAEPDMDTTDQYAIFWRRVDLTRV